MGGESAEGKRPEMQRDAEGPMRMDGKSKKKNKKMSAEDSVSWMPPEDSGKRSGMQPDAEEPTGTLREAKKKKKPGKRKKNRNKGDSICEEVGQQSVTSPETTEEAVNGLTTCESGKRSETPPLPAIYSELSPELREELKALLDIQDKLTSKETAKNQVDKRSENELGRKRFEMSGNPEPEEPRSGLVKRIDMGRIAEEIAQELETFHSHRRLWEDKWSKTCRIFTGATLLSSMQFTHYTPGRTSNNECFTTNTLQIISIQLTELAHGLEFPLYVYGVVAVRDIVDRNRNVLFFRNRYEAQELKLNDNFLHLNGPSRAIVFTNKVWIEIELRVKGGAYSQNEALISSARHYNRRNRGVSTICFKNSLCALELRLQTVEKAVQATILGVQVANDDGSWPFQYGGLVACTPQSGTLMFTPEIDPSPTQIVLIESKDDAMPKGQNAHVLLRRQVVSVNLEGRLDVVIKAYDNSGAIVAKTCVCFDPEVCNISQKKFALGNAKGAVTVAWSRVAATASKTTGAADGLPDEAENELGRKRLEMSGNPELEEAHSDLVKTTEMMRISRDRLLDAEIHKALLYIQDKLKSKETTKIGKDTLRLLKDLSNYKLDLLDDDDQNGEMDKLAVADQTGLNTSDHSSNSPLLVAKKTVAEVMAQEVETFASYRRLWEDKWSKTCGIFTAPTLLSSMLFTHYTPGRTSNTECSTRENLQIISIQLTELADGLEFPLSVYGVVAVRDMVDRNRNVLFFRNSHEAQELKQKDNFLHLIGPSRAVVFTDMVWIEIELRVAGGAYSKNEALMSCARRYSGGNPGVSTICFKNALCTLELCLQPVEKAVQATILGVQVTKDDGSWPFQYGGLVACTPQSGTLRFTDVITREIDPSSTQIVLIESKDDAMPKGQNGYVLLRRQVVSVNLEGRLDVVIKAYDKSGAIIAKTICFDPEVCNISQKKFALGDAKGAVTVAWSRVAASKTGASVGLNGRGAGVDTY